MNARRTHPNHHHPDAHQDGQRNLSDIDREIVKGLLYEARKKSYGGDRKSSMQNANLKSNNGRTVRTDETVAKELGINPSTVDRAAHFAHGIDTIQEADPKIIEQTQPPP